MGYHPHFAQTGLRHAPDKEAAYADVYELLWTSGN